MKYDDSIIPQPKDPDWYFRFQLDLETRLSHQFPDQARF